MNPNGVRTSIDILAAIKQTTAAPAPRKGRLKLDRPLLDDDARKMSSLTSEEIYELGFP